MASSFLMMVVVSGVEQQSHNRLVPKAQTTGMPNSLHEKREVGVTTHQDDGQEYDHGGEGG